MSLTRLRPHRPRPAPSGLLLSDGYLTDGRRLFRVVSQFSDSAAHVFASLEDRLTLEVQAYSPGELHGIRLRRVGSAE